MVICKLCQIMMRNIQIWINSHSEIYKLEQLVIWLHEFIGNIEFGDCSCAPKSMNQLISKS